jgi:hypothetical protein
MAASNNPIQHIANIVCPIPTWDELYAKSSGGSEDARIEGVNTVLELIQNQHDQLVFNLENTDDDPLLNQLRAIRSRIDAETATMRRLLAYGRECAQPRPYTLQALADAAGFTPSGITTAYSADDVAFAAKQSKLTPRKTGRARNAEED